MTGGSNPQFYEKIMEQYQLQTAWSWILWCTHSFILADKPVKKQHDVKTLSEFWVVRLKKKEKVPSNDFVLLFQMSSEDYELQLWLLSASWDTIN